MGKISEKGGGAASSYILLMAAQLVTAILGMIVTKLLSVNFSLQEYGTYSQAILVTSTMSSASILGLTNATNYFYNRTSNIAEQKKYISTIFSLQYIAGILAASAILVIRKPVSVYFSNEELEVVLRVIAATPLLTNLIAMYQNLFVSIGRAKTIAFRNLIVSALRLLAVDVACFVTESIETVLIVILFLDIAQVGYFSLSFSKEKFLISPKGTDLSLAKEILAFSIPMAVYVLTNVLTRDIDKYVISIFSNAEVMAIYSNAARMLPFDMLTASLITVLIPIITRLIHQKNYREAQRLFKLYLRMGYTLTYIFVGGAIAVAHHLMVFLYDAKYISGLPVFIVYLFVDMIRFANVTTILSGAGKTKILMRISIIVLGANLVLNIISYQILGMIGPALTTLGLTILMTALLLNYGAKELKIRIAGLFDFKEIIRVGCEIVLVGGCVHYLADFLVGQLGVPLFATLAISYGAYLTVLFCLNHQQILETFKELNQYR